jgi:hypothetical protein
MYFYHWALPIILTYFLIYLNCFLPAQQPIPQAPWQPNTQLTQPSIPQQNAQLNQQIQALQQQIAQQQIVNDQQIKQSGLLKSDQK